VGRGEDAADLLVAAAIQPVGPGVEGLYDSAALRGFVNIDLGREQVPVETTVCKVPPLTGGASDGGTDLRTMPLSKR